MITANPIGANHHPLLFSHQPTTTSLDSSLPFSTLQTQFPHPSNNLTTSHGLQELSLKRENQQHFNMRPDIPPWLAYNQGPTSLNHLDHLLSSLYSSSLEQEYSHDQNPPPLLPHSLPPPYQASSASPHMSATALLQKASQMGETMSRPPHNGQMAAHTASNASVFGFGLSSHQETNSGGPTPLLQDMMMNSLSSATGFHGSFEDAFGGMLGGSKREEGSNMERIGRSHGWNEGGGSGGQNEGLTRDFLGLRAFSHRDILNMAVLDPCISSSSFEQPQQNNKPWNG